MPRSHPHPCPPPSQGEGVYPSGASIDYLTDVLGLPWATLLTQLAWVSLLASDAVNDRLQALGPLSTALRRALNTVGISAVDVPVLSVAPGTALLPTGTSALRGYPETFLGKKADLLDS